MFAVFVREEKKYSRRLDAQRTWAADAPKYKKKTPPR